MSKAKSEALKGAMGFVMKNFVIPSLKKKEDVKPEVKKTKPVEDLEEEEIEEELEEEEDRPMVSLSALVSKEKAAKLPVRGKNGKFQKRK